MCEITMGREWSDGHGAWIPIVRCQTHYQTLVRGEMYSDVPMRAVLLAMQEHMNGYGPLPFTCPRCGSVSHHPKDIAEGYCGRCKGWTRKPVYMT